MLRTSLFAIAVAIPGFLSAQEQVCDLTDAGAGCGASLQASWQPIGNGGQKLHLLATGLHPNSFGAMVWGTQQLNMPVLPFSNCMMLVGYDWGFSFATGPDGAKDYARSWPESYMGHFYIQFGSIGTTSAGALDIRMTSCVLARCSPQ